MKLSVSLYSNKDKSIKDSASLLEEYGVDYWHIDSIDNLEVFKDIRELANCSNIPVDLHIISSKTEDYIPYLSEKNISRVSFQVEELNPSFQFPIISGKQMGLAIQLFNPNIEQILNRYHEQVQFVLLMMTTPGVSGGQFQKKNFAIIRSLVEKFPSIHWCIDGGVNHEISYILRLIGIQSVVIGSYLMQHQNMAEAILQIRSHYVRSEYKLLDYALPSQLLPIIDRKSSVLDMLQKMQDFKIGIVFYINQEGVLEGVISNADVRKVLLSGDFNYQMSIESFVNRFPKMMYEDQTTSEMIDYIHQTDFPLLVLPVVARNGTLRGAISFHKLLKEE